MTSLSTKRLVSGYILICDLYFLSDDVTPESLCILQCHQIRIKVPRSSRF